MAVPSWYTRRHMKQQKPAERRYHTRSVARSALDEFFNRPRDNWTWIKKIDEWKLRLHMLSRWHQYEMRPRTAQLAGLGIGMEENQFIYNYGCGVGKSALDLLLIQYHMMTSGIRPWLILVPNVINFQTWEDQIQTHAPGLTYQILAGGSRKKRHSMVEADADIFVLNYGGLMSYMTDLDKEEGGRVLNRRAGNSFADLFKGLIFDEIHEVGNRDAKRYWMCRRLSRAIKYRYANSATLFGHDPLPMWSAFDLIDHGYTLGETLGLFRGVFYKEVEHRWKGVDYVFDKSKKLLLAETIRHRSLRYTAAECGDMPAVNRIPERLTWDKEQHTFYQRVISECKLAGIGKVKLNPHTYTRMRQICSGYVGYEGDDGKAQYQFSHNPKLERLLQVIREMPKGHKIIVGHQYLYTGAMIVEALKKHKIGVAEVRGNVKNSAEQYGWFLEDDNYTALVANYRMLTGGNPHMVASWMYFFESPPDPTTRTQFEEREVRPGQPNKVFIYDPIMPNSVDESLLEALEQGRDFHDQVADGTATVSDLAETE